MSCHFPLKSWNFPSHKCPGVLILLSCAAAPPDSNNVEESGEAEPLTKQSDVWTVQYKCTTNAHLLCQEQVAEYSAPPKKPHTHTPKSGGDLNKISSGKAALKSRNLRIGRDHDEHLVQPLQCRKAAPVFSPPSSFLAKKGEVIN